MRTILMIPVLLACVLPAGCLSSAPIVPVTPANTAQISSCESTASQHDGYVIGDFVVGGVSAGLAAAAAAVSDTNTKTGLGVGAAGAAAVGVTLAALAELTASNFANSQCPTVVGSLPTAPTPSASSTPAQ